MKKRNRSKIKEALSTVVDFIVGNWIVLITALYLVLITFYNTNAVVYNSDGSVNKIWEAYYYLVNSGFTISCLVFVKQHLWGKPKYFMVAPIVYHIMAAVYHLTRICGVKIISLLNVSQEVFWSGFLCIAVIVSFVYIIIKKE